MDHKKNNLYHQYFFNKTALISIIISDRDLNKLKTIAKNNSFVTVEDYIINLIDNEYSFLDASSIIKVKNKSACYDKDNDAHILKKHILASPKLLKPDDNINDTKQLTLNKYLVKE